ncbi:sugar-transfer associated ATP-grasp domain-containing protein [Mangrovibacterium lignilyticum]|uniref:sugar-transfer associated ATP-grasp domain-containing protein n=1 Tax=Mangrovibacterium lignilyticum TaxID=2668052 RepID=UPI0013D1FC8F|nr:sugar-transfer associated ATP-grasp domain-containing protein [Mangrovibacterium lignilyticum]
MEKSVEIAKKLVLKAKWKRYNIIQNAEARKTLKEVEKHKGNSSADVIRMCDEYALDIFGNKMYAPWLYVYSVVSGTFKEGWIPDNYYGRYIVPSWMGDYGNTSFLKPFSKNILNSNLFPDIGCYVNGLWLNENLEVVKEGVIVDCLFKNSEKIVFKTERNSYQGRGVHFFTKRDFDMYEIKSLGNGVFQEYIEQNEVLAEIMPDSVATIRITTLFEETGDISVRSCYLRLGRSSQTHILRDTEIAVNVDRGTGTLNSDAYLSDYSLVKYHPDTLVTFADKRIPSFEKCVEAAVILHRKIPQVRYIGWDMTVDRNDNVRIMEWNGGHTDIKFSEATVGPCFADLGWEQMWRGQKLAETEF